MEDNYWTSLAARRITRRSALRAAALGAAGLSGAALIGCGGGDDGAPAASNTGGSTPGGATAPAPTVSQPKPGGRVARASSGDPPSFDQHGQSSTVTNLPASPFFNTLVQFDPTKPQEKPGDIIPDLAASWEVSKDGMTYTFKMKSGVKFHDGTPFVAGDVKASLQRQITPPRGLVPPRQDQLKVIKSMETPDDLTLKINMSRPSSPLSMLPILGQGWMAIYAQKDIANDKFDWRNSVNGTGPYRDLKYERGAKITMERNKEYHVKDRPYLDGLDVFIIPQAPSRDAALQSGQIQIGAMPAGSAESLKKNIGDKANYYKTDSLGFSVLNYNSAKTPWNDERVRQAVNLAINREDAVRIVAKGEAVTPGGYLLPSGDWALSAEEIRKLPGYGKQGPDANAEAKKMVAAAGVKEGLDVSIMVRQAFYEDLCLFTGDQLAGAFGWKIRQDLAETAVAYDRMNKRDFDLVPWGHGISLDDPDAIWAEMYLKGAPRNYSEISTPAIEEAYLKQTVELDPAKRKVLVNQLERVSLPALGKAIYYWSRGQSAVYKQVQGYLPHISGYNNTKFQDVWLST